MEEIELTAEELYQKKISDEFKRLKNLPHKQVVIPQEMIEQEIQNSIKQERIRELKEKLKELSYDFIQAQAGAVIPDIEAKKIAFKEYHNELRELLGKNPRLYL